MVPTENRSLNEITQDEDFIPEEYRKLVKLARKNYEVGSYSDDKWRDRSILWRHDVGFKC